MYPTEEELEYLSNQVLEGYTSGKFTSQGRNVAWTLSLNIWVDDGATESSDDEELLD